MYWPDHTREDDEYLLREKIFPPAVKVPDFKSTDWNPKGIQIGGVPDELDVNFCYNSMCGNFGLSHSQAETEKRKKTLLNTQKREPVDAGVSGVWPDTKNI